MPIVQIYGSTHLGSSLYSDFEPERSIEWFPDDFIGKEVWTITTNGWEPKIRAVKLKVVKRVNVQSAHCKKSHVEVTLSGVDIITGERVVLDPWVTHFAPKIIEDLLAWRLALKAKVQGRHV